MQKIISYILMGFGIAWFSFMMFTSYYLYKRDEVIKELLKENKRLKNMRERGL